MTDSPQPGQAHTAVMPEATAAAEAKVRENQHVAVNEIASCLDTSYGSASTPYCPHCVIKFIEGYHLTLPCI